MPLQRVSSLKNQLALKEEDLKISQARARVTTTEIEHLRDMIAKKESGMSVLHNHLVSKFGNFVNKTQAVSPLFTITLFWCSFFCLLMLILA